MNSQQADPSSFPRLLSLGARNSCQKENRDSPEIILALIITPPTVSCSLAPHSYLITLSARARTCGGIVRPICFAIFMFTQNSNFVGRSTGMSAGLAPFKILST